MERPFLKKGTGGHITGRMIKKELIKSRELDLGIIFRDDCNYSAFPQD